MLIINFAIDRKITKSRIAQFMIKMMGFEILRLDILYKTIFR